MNFAAGLSAIRASQLAIDTISHNLANAGTEGYHRQEVIYQAGFSNRVGRHFIGTGVDINEIRRFRNQVSERALTNVTADFSRVEQSLLIESRIELLVSPGQGSIQTALNGMFDGFTRLSANPGDVTLRDSILFQANNLAGRMREASGELLEMREAVRQQINVEVDELNLEIEELVDLQNQIAASVEGQVPGDLLDRRDQLINEIATRIDVQRFELPGSPLGLGMASNSVILGTVPFKFETVTDGQGNIEIQLENGNRPVTIAGGRVAALVEANNSFINGFSEQLDEFSSQLIRQVDQMHAGGVGVNGSFDVLRGVRPVSDVDAPLAESAAFPITAGELFITVTSPAGELRTVGVAVDPETDSLQDLAARISGIDNLQASVDSSTGNLTMIAAPGYKFDFTGRMETQPDLANFSGSSLPSIGGNYSGTENETLQIVAIGSGEVGKTQGLRMQLQNANGDILSEFDVGDGYTAGSEIDLGNGVTIGFGVGQINTGDQIDIVQVASSDNSGVLSALGLNNFFTGDDAGSIAVDDRFKNSPEDLASSRSGEIADTRNLESLVELKEALVLGDGNVTFNGYLEEINSQIGFRVQTTRGRHESLSELQFQYQAERDSISGVDVNEELINLTTHQKNYEAAIQVVRTMEAMIDDLFRIIS